MEDSMIKTAGLIIMGFFVLFFILFPIVHMVEVDTKRGQYKSKCIAEEIVSEYKCWHWANAKMMEANK